MAPPKHRTSKSKTRHRRSHHGVDLPHLVVNKDTNELSKSHFSPRVKNKKVEVVEPEKVSEEKSTKKKSK